MFMVGRTLRSLSIPRPATSFQKLVNLLTLLLYQHCRNPWIVGRCRKYMVYKEPEQALASRLPSKCRRRQDHTCLSGLVVRIRCECHFQQRVGASAGASARFVGFVELQEARNARGMYMYGGRSGNVQACTSLTVRCLGSTASVCVPQPRRVAVQRSKS